MKEEASVPSFLIVLCRSEPDPARLKQCRERIEREKLGYFYLYGERKHMRAIREAIPSARAVEITNSANYDSVRGQPRCSLFDVGLRPEIAPGDDGGKRPPSLRL